MSLPKRVTRGERIQYPASFFNQQRDAVSAHERSKGSGGDPSRNVDPQTWVWAQVTGSSDPIRPGDIVEAKTLLVPKNAPADLDTHRYHPLSDVVFRVESTDTGTEVADLGVALDYGVGGTGQLIRVAKTGIVSVRLEAEPEFGHNFMGPGNVSALVGSLRILAAYGSDFGGGPYGGTAVCAFEHCRSIEFLGEVVSSLTGLFVKVKLERSTNQGPADPDFGEYACHLPESIGASLDVGQKVIVTWFSHYWFEDYPDDDLVGGTPNFVVTTALRSDAKLKTAYESNANTNAYTDAEKTKLAGL